MTVLHGTYRCGNPTCSAFLYVSMVPLPASWDGISLPDGWVMQQQPDDLVRLPYCGRCKL